MDEMTKTGRSYLHLLSRLHPVRQGQVRLRLRCAIYQSARGIYAYQFLVDLFVRILYPTFPFPRLFSMSATVDHDQSSPATRVATPLPVAAQKHKSLENPPDSPTTVVAELPPEDEVLANASLPRKLALMALFSAAQFLDAFNNRCVHPFY